MFLVGLVDVEVRVVYQKVYYAPVQPRERQLDIELGVWILPVATVIDFEEIGQESIRRWLLCQKDLAGVLRVSDPRLVALIQRDDSAQHASRALSRPSAVSMLAEHLNVRHVVVVDLALADQLESILLDHEYAFNLLVVDYPDRSVSLKAQNALYRLVALDLLLQPLLVQNLARNCAVKLLGFGLSDHALRVLRLVREIKHEPEVRREELDAHAH